MCIKGARDANRASVRRGAPLNFSIISGSPPAPASNFVELPAQRSEIALELFRGEVHYFCFCRCRRECDARAELLLLSSLCAPPLSMFVRFNGGRPPRSVRRV